jgi:DNA-binding CsgD family transcriptional regulator
VTDSRPGRVVRRLPMILLAVAVLGAGFGAAVLPRPFTALAPALGAGLLAQLAATWVLVRMGSRPYAGMAAVSTVASLLVIVHSPWQELVAAQAVPWVPIALAWATVRPGRAPAALAGVVLTARSPSSGASGFLLKTTPPARLIPFVLAAAAGASVLSPEAVQRLRDRHSAAPDPAPDPGIDALTPREREVLALLGEGRSNADIAARLYLSEGTVKGHVSRLMAILGCQNRTQLALRAARHGGQP